MDQNIVPPTKMVLLYPLKFSNTTIEKKAGKLTGFCGDQHRYISGVSGRQIASVLLFTLLAASTPMALAKVQWPLLGKWYLQSASEQIPAACRNAWLDFVSISKLVVSDGSRQVVLDYSAEKIPSGQGYNLIAKIISDNGKPGCHPKDKVMSNNSALAYFYIMLSADSKRIRLYFSSDSYYQYQRTR